MTSCFPIIILAFWVLLLINFNECGISEHIQLNGTLASAHKWTDAKLNFWLRMLMSFYNISKPKSIPPSSSLGIVDLTVDPFSLDFAHNKWLLALPLWDVT